METQKPKFIKTLGLLIAILSGFMTFSNAMGALAFTLIGAGEQTNNMSSDQSGMSFLFKNYLLLCLIMVAFGILFMIGGIYVKRYKLWANKLVTIISAILIVIIFSLMIVMSNAFGQEFGSEGLSYFPILNAALWSTPFGLIIWYLNRKQIKQHFS